MGQKLFIQELTRTFRLISDWDNILGASAPSTKAVAKLKKA